MFFSFEISYVFMKVIFVNTLLYFHSDAFDLNYSELQRMNATCFPDDSCPFNIEESYQRKCDCDPLCSMYDSCCINSPYLQTKGTFESATSVVSCRTPVGSSDTYYMVSKCDLGWNGSGQIQSMCEDGSQNIQDHVGSVPVTDTKSQITYKNYFCAVCNNISEDLIFWDIHFKIDGNKEDYSDKSEDDIIEALEFDNVTERWAMRTLDAENGIKLVPINFKHGVPTSLYYDVRKCTPSVISECAADWTDELIKKKCKSYMAKVSFEDSPFVVYRNVHCALCNGVNITKLQCFLEPTSVNIMGTMFPFLLDINLKTGSKVGKKKQCLENQMYDPFFKKCRVLKCVTANYTISEGRCRN